MKEIGICSRKSLTLNKQDVYNKSRSESNEESSGGTKLMMYDNTNANLINYTNDNDEDLIRKIKSGDNQALDFLLNKYKEIVNMKVSRYFIIGAEKEDIIQEGLIGLYKAIKSYDPDKQNSFKSFANLCVERQLITAIKTSNRQKHMPLNSYLSLNMSAYDDTDDDTSIYEVFDANVIEDPLDTITKKEYYKDVENIIKKSLSPFERQVLAELVNGNSYTVIAEKLDSPVKSIDNAIQRIRKKTSKNIYGE